MSHAYFTEWVWRSVAAINLSYGFIRKYDLFQSFSVKCWYLHCRHFAWFPLERNGFNTIVLLLIGVLCSLFSEFCIYNEVAFLLLRVISLIYLSAAWSGFGYNWSSFCKWLCTVPYLSCRGRAKWGQTVWLHWPILLQHMPLEWHGHCPSSCHPQLGVWTTQGTTPAENKYNNM